MYLVVSVMLMVGDGDDGGVGFGLILVLVLVLVFVLVICVVLVYIMGGLSWVLIREDRDRLKVGGGDSDDVELTVSDLKNA